MSVRLVAEVRCTVRVYYLPFSHGTRKLGYAFVSLRENREVASYLFQCY